GNYLWHYEGTGHAMAEVFNQIAGKDDHLAGVTLTTGSAGTLASGDYLKKLFPMMKIVASEALHCPTLLNNGFGEHRIEGIGDKHIPWIHNVKNTDVVVAVDDDIPMNLIRLFNEPAGLDFLREQGVTEEFLDKLPLMGISGIANIVTAIKFAKYFELTKQDVIMTICTDSMEMYRSRLSELTRELGEYSRETAIKDYHRYLMALTIDHLSELTYYQKKRIHNLKYYTWVEQQHMDPRELDAQWYDAEYWSSIENQVGEIDKLIEQFNQQTGLLKKM
ncbi:MAG: pyridoxal-5-phosphate-dependent protein subunit beta, partial [Firmicutes bacterium]|nr:pyridoxal-5-phosphate-dependent protein subunit beta [Bacillota bacterium]